MIADPSQSRKDLHGNPIKPASRRSTPGGEGSGDRSLVGSRPAISEGVHRGGVNGITWLIRGTRFRNGDT